MSDLFGYQNLKFISGANTVELNYVIPEAPGTDNRIIEHESIINTFRSWTNKTDDDHIEVSILIHLFKYANPVSKFTELMSYNHSLVDALFYDINRLPFQDAESNTVRFFIWQIQPLFLFSPKGYDALRITFRSETPVKLDLSTEPITGGKVLTDTPGNIITDTPGTTITDEDL